MSRFDIVDLVELSDDLLILRPERSHLGMRLDRYVADLVPDMSRGTIQGLIEEGHILVDGMQRKAKFRLTPGEVVTVEKLEPAPTDLEPDHIPLDIVYEDDDVIVVDKPAGMVVHPAPGHARMTLANALVAHVPGISVGGSGRPGIVHRLDKDTSGLIVAAKSDRGHSSLIRQWGERTVKKNYLALVAGSVADDEATIDAPLGRDPKNRQRMAVVRNGRPSVTHFRVLQHFSNATLLEVTIETGRTHQIRTHLAFIGHPVIGDMVYGRRGLTDPSLERQFLHASELGFTLPAGDAVRFRSPLPADLSGALEQLRASAESPP